MKERPYKKRVTITENLSNQFLDKMITKNKNSNSKKWKLSHWEKYNNVKNLFFWYIFVKRQLVTRKQEASLLGSDREIAA